MAEWREWTAEDLGFLSGSWGRIDIADIARQLQRTPEAIRRKAHVVGLPPWEKAAWEKDHDLITATPEKAAEALLQTALEAWGRVKPILTKPVPKKKTRWGLHEAGLMLSDCHIGLQVDPKTTGGLGGYSVDIAAERCRQLRDSLIEITQIHQTAMDVRRLNVFALGDELEGHGQIYPAQPFYLDAHLYQQWLVFAEMMVSFLRDLLQVYDKIKVYKVYANHGRLGKKGEGHPQDNVELLVWHYISARLADEPRIKFAISPSWFMLVNRMGWNFYIAHGEDTLPWSPYAARGAFNVKLRLNSLFEQKIHYLLLAHHHVSLEIERELEGSIIYNGCWPGPTDWSLKALHEANLPSQNFFLITRKYGVRALDKIRLADLQGIRDVSIDED